MRKFGQHNGRHGLEASMRQLVFGLEDGIVSTTGAVVGIAAGSQNANVVILSGTVLILVEALSMAAGEYLSSKSHREFLEQKIREEEGEVEQPDHEREELSQMYRDRGFNEEEIAILVKRITANKQLWLEEMIAKELGIGKGELTEAPSGAAVMWLSYTIGGAVPLAPFFFLSPSIASIASFMVAVISLFGLGYWKAKVAGINALRSATEMLVVGAGAGILGYMAGAIIGAWLGLPAQLQG